MSGCNDGNHVGEGTCGNSDGGKVYPEKPLSLPSDFQPQGPSSKSRTGTAISREEFLQSFERNFKSQLSLSHLARVKKGDNIALAFSGGPSSRALLHVLHSTMTSRSAKKEFCKVTILHVDVTGALNMNEQTRKEHIEEIKQICSSYTPNYPLHITSLEELFIDEKEKDHHHHHHHHHQYYHVAQKKLQQYMESFKTLSAREDAFHQLVVKSILLAAESLNIPKIISGECADRIAIRILSDVSKGRGYSLVHSVQSTDTHFSKMISILRPLKDMLSKEIAIYNHYLKLKTIPTPSITTFLPLKTSSIDRLVESFVTALQTDYPSSVHTIVRTTEKLKKPESVFSNANCLLCGAVLSNEEIDELKKGNQTDQTISLLKCCCYGCKRQLSYKTGIPNLIDSIVLATAIPAASTTDDGEKITNVTSSSSSSSAKNISSSFSELKLSNVEDEFPIFVRKNKESMYNEIKEFLINDDE